MKFKNAGQLTTFLQENNGSLILEKEEYSGVSFKVVANLKLPSMLIVFEYECNMTDFCEMFECDETYYEVFVSAENSCNQFELMRLFNKYFSEFEYVEP